MKPTNEPIAVQPKKIPSKISWLIVAFIVFVLGAIVCGTGSATAVFFAAALTLPAVLSKRRAESAFGVLLLCFCLGIGSVIYSKQNENPSSYWNYLKRAKVNLSLSILEQLKSPVEAFYAAQHACPNPKEIGIAITNKYVENIVHTHLSDDKKCLYTAFLKTDAGFDANATLGLVYLSESRTWSCKNADTGTTTLNPIYLPFKCKN
ncbi:Pilin (bacterial filament) [Beggiatoa alba B18LD]|uniref:Pilin (Bacterial filament) n=1 Tax=Beggiatoa alba B18LD TaxID=395493 RepID=I3CKR4_9GAMM|nr:pilin [Beggiatoa alba]EIJ44207.1 Pilin (bacterial filament) [Beggiatoa alba B18LD]